MDRILRGDLCRLLVGAPFALTSEGQKAILITQPKQSNKEHIYAKLKIYSHL